VGECNWGGAGERVQLERSQWGVCKWEGAGGALQMRSCHKRDATRRGANWERATDSVRVGTPAGCRALAPGVALRLSLAGEVVEGGHAP